MLFNSLPFIFVFLPITFLVFFVAGCKSLSFACVWLCAASLLFYGWWNPSFVSLLLASVIFNYISARLINHESRNAKHNHGRALLILAIAANLLLLGYFKYAGFFTNITNMILDSQISLGQIVLPLGISFFAFTQIAFLVDVYQKRAEEFNFVHWLLFVNYFPHLIAGPIIHHARVMPQFSKAATYRIDWLNASAGMTMFLMGLAKKILIADRFGAIATPIFSAAQNGAGPPIVEAWAGALAYTLQLYFDFSGYSDMAIGLSLFFNIKLPFNFNSPYKAPKYHRFLAKMAHDIVRISSRLPLYCARRQPQGSKAPLHQSFRNYASRGTLAWSRLDICRVGCFARWISDYKSRFSSFSR